MLSEKKPNFFIVGAAKSGTTSLCKYLEGHEEVFFCLQRKEPLFFCSDHEHKEAWRVKNMEEYLEIFSDAGNSKRIGEGSVWNLYSPGAAKRIKDFNPETKIIIMLRNPVDLVFSLHGQFLYSCNETIRDFESAYRLQDIRAQGRKIPSKAHFPLGLQYTDVALFSKQVERYLNEFGSENVHIVFFEEFITNLEDEFNKILEFLEIDTKYRPDFQIINPRKNVKYLWLQRLLFKKLYFWSGDWLPDNKIGNGLKWRLTHLKAKLMKWNIIEKKIPPLTMELRNIIHNDFIDDINQLEYLLGRVPSSWEK